MIRIYSPDDEMDLAFIRSLLIEAEIPYYVHNDHFGTMRTGPRIELLNRKTIMVPESFADTARSIISEYFKCKEPADEPVKQKYSFLDKIRMVFEMLLFGWFVPGNRWTEKRKENKQIKD